MKILIAGKFVPSGHNKIGGLQSWIKTVENELYRLGHTVQLWQPDMILKGDFDLGIISNIDLTRKAIKHCRKTILVSHGIIEAEKPYYLCDKLLFVSEGVRNHWDMDGEIIRQPIDLDFWSPRQNKTNLVSRYSYRTGNTHCEPIATTLNREYCHINGVTHEQARKIICNSLVVFATGRAALESMACGVPTVIYDHRQAYQPPLMGLDLDLEMQNSYSGRSGTTPTFKQVLSATDKAVNKNNWRDWVVANHDVKKIVKELISTY